ncbi:unnamed protein product [Menidia menidia]|uniref:(Atlantic silverside) hypothetical protein n=1 Tax=Menidia menidia TaxID=238744 RepID=A0A8S4AKC9_9TELE|nr:unnamed protein product [Menidia menidia]
MGQGGKQMCETDAVRPKTAVQLPLAGSTVTVSKRDFLRLNRSGMTIFSQELAGIHKAGPRTLHPNWKVLEGGPPKTQLDVPKVPAITDAVLLEFLQTSVSDVRTAIRRKCYDEQFSQKKRNMWCTCFCMV